MKKYKMYGKFEFRPDEKYFYVFLIALAIFILGVQVGIKHGRTLELEDLSIKYGYHFTDQKNSYIKKYSRIR